MVFDKNGEFLKIIKYGCLARSNQHRPLGKNKYPKKWINVYSALAEHLLSVLPRVKAAKTRHFCPVRDPTEKVSNGFVFFKCVSYSLL
jgi:hypothetical protein